MRKATHITALSSVANKNAALTSTNKRPPPPHKPSTINQLPSRQKFPMVKSSSGRHNRIDHKISGIDLWAQKTPALQVMCMMRAESDG
ncbi:hypothetical protein Bpfe_012110, partial [Biomphalaria pfeifferi]